MSRFQAARFAAGALMVPLLYAAVDKPAGGADRSDTGRTGTLAKRPLRLVASIASADDLTTKRGASPQAPRVDFRIVKPNAVALDKSGRIFVADPGQKGVVIYDRQAQTAVRWSGNDRYPLYGPAGIAFDDSGRTFVTDVYKAHVIVFDSSGTPTAVIGKATLKRPDGIAIDTGRGRIYVADMRLNQVLSFDLRTFDPGPSIGAPVEAGNTGDGRLSGAANLAVDSKGQVYVSDAMNCRIQVFSPSGTFVRAFTPACGHASSGSALPIAVSGDDRLFAVNPEDSTVHVYTPDGKHAVFTPAPTKAQPAGQPKSIALDAENRIYVTQQSFTFARVDVYEAGKSQAKTGQLASKSK